MVAIVCRSPCRFDQGGHAMAVTRTSDSAAGLPDRRKLIAVAHKDMAGCSRLIGLDDAGTLRRLRKLRRELIDAAIEEHGGEIVQTGGNSLLIVFDSIDGAVRCAAKVQEQVPIRDGDQPADRAIRFRVGIDLGDAIADGTDLHGDAENLAARLQAECPPGGICISRSVRDHVHGRLDFERHYERTVEVSKRALVRYPNDPRLHHWLAAALGRLGHSGEARVTLQEATKLSSTALDFHIKHPVFRPEDREHLRDGLRKAGWQG
jgi:class 3 adenylate cyclase